MVDSLARELIARGLEARREDWLEDAWFLFSDAVHRCRKAKDTGVLAEALAELGQIERDEGKTQAALRHYGEVVELLRGEGNGRRLAHAIRHVADIERGQRNLAKAGTDYEEALALYRAEAETPALEMANALRGFALLKGETGEDEEAKYLWYEARHCMSRRV